MSKKYKLTDETLVVDGHTLYRIKALKTFSNVKVGDLGGWIEKEDNLSQYEKCWVYGNACVYSNAQVSCDARMYGNAVCCDNAQAYDRAVVSGDAIISGRTRVSLQSNISGTCVLNFDTNEVIYNVTLDCGVWVNTYSADEKKYIISNTLETICIGPVNE
jgi:hypothetical protein